MMWGYGFSWGGMFLMLLSSMLWIALLVGHLPFAKGM